MKTSRKSGGRLIRRLSFDEALALYQSDDIFNLASSASAAAERVNGRNAYYVRNVHVNPTNLCVNRCAFCAFSRSKGQEGAYELTIPQILKLIKKAGPISEAHIVGGLHPEWDFDYYVHLVSKIKTAFPKLHIKAFTAAEIDYMHRTSGIPVGDILCTLKKAGVESMPGGGAEIFNEAVRGRLCPEKISGERWLEIMEIAHETGIKTNATMLYGHHESLEDRVDHLMRLRALQDKTGGFQAFIPLPYQPTGRQMDVDERPASSGIDDLKTIAVSRLVLDNFPHIKAYWVMLGEKVSQLALRFGADDLDGTIMEERISYAAAGKSRRSIKVPELEELIRRAGKKPVERDSFYRAVRKRKGAAGK